MLTVIYMASLVSASLRSISSFTIDQETSFCGVTLKKLPRCFSFWKNAIERLELSHPHPRFKRAYDYPQGTVENKSADSTTT